MDKQTLKRKDLDSKFDLLPCEMAVKVFDYIPHHQRKKCRLVCQRWRAILDNWPYYFVFNSILGNSSMKHFLETYQTTMERAELKNLTADLPDSQIELLPQIKHARIGWRNSEENIRKYLKYVLQTSETLRIQKFGLGQLRSDVLSETLEMTMAPNMSEVSLDVNLTRYKFDRAVLHLEATVLFLKVARIPNIQTFDFRLLHQYEAHRSKVRREHRFNKLCLAIYDFLAAHAKTLKYLFCNLFTTRRPKGRFSIPEISEEIKATLASEMNLEICQFKFWGVRQIEAIINPAMFGSQLQNLRLDTSMPLKGVGRPWGSAFRTTVDPDNGVGTNLTTLRQNLNQIFINNARSLKTVTFISFPHVNLASFESCTALETIYIKMTLITPQEFGDPNFLPESYGEIFQASAQTLQNVTLMSFDTVNFGWFRHCSELKVLYLDTFEGTGRTLHQQLREEGDFPPMKHLELLRVYIQIGNEDSAGEIQQLINRSGKSLQTLTLNPENLFVGDRLNLVECVALRDLDLWGSPERYMENATDSNFSNVTKFYTSIYEYYPNAEEELINWIFKTMPNLQEVGYVMLSEVTYIDRIRRFLQIPNVVKIASLGIKPENLANMIAKFCAENRGLILEEGSDTNGSALNWIIVDRSIYGQ